MNNNQSQFHAKTVLVVTTLASFLIPVMTSSTNVALPAIGQEFGINVVALGWVSNAFLLASAALLLPLGRIADIHGRRRVFSIGTVVFAVGSALAAVSVSGGMLILARVIQGMGGAAIFSTSVAILTSMVPPGERGKVLGINTGAVYLGLSLGPVMGGLLNEHIGWRSIFVMAFVLMIVVIVLNYWKLRGELIEHAREEFDLTGAIIYGIAMVLMMYGVTLLPTSNGVWLVGGGLAACVILLWWENRTAKPLVNLGIFRHNRGFAFSNLAALINYSGSWAVAFLLSLYLQYIKGLNSQMAGLVLITNPAVQALLSPWAGRLSDRFEPRVLASTGMALTAISIGLLALPGEGASIFYIVGCLVLLGIGFALFSSPNTNAVMSSVVPHFYGVASATLATSRQIGMMLSTAVVMLVFATVIGHVEITPQYYPAFVQSMRIALLICAILCLCGVFASLARGNIHEDKTAGH